MAVFNRNLEWTPSFPFIATPFPFSNPTHSLRMSSWGLGILPIHSASSLLKDNLGPAPFLQSVFHKVVAMQCSTYTLILSSFCNCYFQWFASSPCISTVRSIQNCGLLKSGMMTLCPAVLCNRRFLCLPQPYMMFYVLQSLTLTILPVWTI